MFESRGNLIGSTVETLRKFCLIVSPTGKAFHPIFFLNFIEKNTGKRGEHARFFNQPSGINMMLIWSHQRALAKHLKENPSGPCPNQMTFRNFANRFYSSIQYVTNHGTGIRIGIPYPSMKNVLPSRLIVFGKNRHEVWKRAQVAGLPEPTWVEPIFPVFPALPSYLHQPESRPEKIPLEQLLNVRVPIGDLLDFLGKYAR